MMSNSFRKYFICFFLFGQSYFPLWPKTYKFCRILIKIPLLLRIAHFVYSAYVINMQPHMKNNKFELFWRLVTSIILMPSLCEIIINISHPQQAFEIIVRLINISNDLNKKLNGSSKESKPLRSYNRKIIVILGFAFLSYALRLTFLPPDYSQLTEIMLISLYFLKDLSVLHFLFHMCLVNQVFVELKSYMGLFSVTQKSKKQKLGLLCYIKLVHRQIWQNTYVINRRFSWTLMSILFESAVNIIWMVYWMFWFQVQYKGNRIVILRKYFLFEFFNAFCLVHPRRFMGWKI